MMNGVRRLGVLMVNNPELYQHTYLSKSSPMILTNRWIKCSSHVCQGHKSIEKTNEFKALNLFDEIASQKKTLGQKEFKQAIAVYLEQESVYRRGSVEFINSALKQMKRYGVIRDLTSYKALLSVFPEDTMVPQSSWQAEMMHFPKQQQCAIDIMEQMERNGVIPDQRFGDLLYDRFGDRSHAFRKYSRLIYWLPKFQHANPYPIPTTLPDCKRELAKLALNRMCIDNKNQLTIWETNEIEAEGSEDTFIVSAMSPGQRNLITKHPVDKPLFVEGYYTTWLRYTSQLYFILRAEPDIEKFKKLKQTEDDSELFNWNTVFEEEDSNMLMNEVSMHEQEDGTILGMCITGTASKNSVMTWIRCLQDANPKLKQIPIVFSIKTPLDDVELEEILPPKRTGFHQIDEQ